MSQSLVEILSSHYEIGYPLEIRQEAAERLIGQVLMNYTALMHMATTPEEQKQWMAQWRAAEVALYEQKFLELQAMTESDSARIANFIMWWTPEMDYWLPIWKSEVNSGLIEQQRLFQKLGYEKSSH